MIRLSPFSRQARLPRSRRLLGLVLLAAVLGIACLDRAEPVEPGTEVPAVPPFHRAVLDGFGDQIDAALDSYGVPGAAVVVVYRDHAVFSGGFGYRQLDRRQPMSENSLFRIGGVTALLSSTLLATLVDERRLDWHRGLGAGLPAAVDRILAAAGDLPPFDIHPCGDGAAQHGGAAGDLVPEMPADGLASLLGQAAAASSLYGEPMALLETVDSGSTDVYAEVVHAALQAAGLGGASAFRRQMQERLLAPAGMSRSAVADRLPTLAEDFATPYGLSLEGQLIAADFSPPAAGAASAGVVSTAGDLGRFLIVHLAGGISQSGKRVASARNLELSRRALFSLPESDVPGGEDSWPLAESCCGGGGGWQTADLCDELWLGGEGGIEGFTATLGILPHHQLGLVVLANLDARLGGRHFGREIRDIFLSRVLGRPGTVAHGLDHRKLRDYLEHLERRSSPVRSSEVAAVEAYLGLYEGGWRARFAAGELRLEGSLEVLPLRRLEGGYVISSGPRLGSRLRFERLEGRPALVFVSPSGDALHVVRKLD